MASQKITQLASLTEMANTFLMMGVDTTDTTMAPTGTNKKVLPSVMAQYFASTAYGPWDANVASAEDWNAAISNGKAMICVTESFSFNQDVVLTSNTTVYLSPGVSVSQSTYQINRNNFILTIMCDSWLTIGGWSWNSAVSANNACVNVPTSGDANEFIPIQLFNCKIINSGTGGTFDPSCRYLINNAAVISGGGDKSGLNITIENSHFSNLYAVTLTPATSRIIVLADNTTSGGSLSIYNPNGLTSDAASIGEGVLINGVLVWGSDTNLTIKGKVTGLSSPDGSNINVTIDGNDAVLSSANLNDGALTIQSTATTPKVTTSNSGGTFTNNSSTYKGAANTGTITNTLPYRAYVKFSSTGGTITIAESYNVSSITYVQVGIYLINFTNALNTNTYPVLITADDEDIFAPTNISIMSRCGNGDTTTTTCRIGTIDQNATAYVDCSTISVLIP